jgi:DNA-damage-inducible protein J
MTTTLQTRIDPKLKADAKKALEGIGLDLSSGIKLFLTQVVRTQSIPFELFTADNFSEEKRQMIIRETKEALKSGKYFNSAEELHADIMK